MLEILARQRPVSIQGSIGGSVKRILLIALFAILAVAAPAAANKGVGQTGTLSVSPVSVAAGDTVTVSGCNYTAGGPFELSIISPKVNGSSTEYDFGAGTTPPVVVDSSGCISLDFVTPTGVVGTWSVATYWHLHLVAKASFVTS